MSELAPIVLFVYNRPSHTRKCLESLSRNYLADESALYIYSDGPNENASNEQFQKIKEVRKLIREKQWCKVVYFIESEKNKGLANSVIAGVTEIVKKFGKIIVLEDDLLTSVGFLKYMNDALNLYANDEKIMQISGHSFPIEKSVSNHASYLIPMTTSWGWGTWKRAWNRFDPSSTGYEILKTDLNVKAKFDLDNSFPYSSMLLFQMTSKEFNSWAIGWWWSVFKADGISLFPDNSLVKNIGFDSSGTHTKNADPFPLKNFDENYVINKFPTEIKPDEFLFDQVKQYLRNETKRRETIGGSVLVAAKNIIRNLKSFLFNNF